MSAVQIGATYRVLGYKPIGAELVEGDLVRVIDASGDDVYVVFVSGRGATWEDVSDMARRTRAGVGYDWYVRARYLELASGSVAGEGQESLDTFALLARTERGRF